MSMGFAEFAQSWGFKHATSSPHYPQSNGATESAVKNAKRKTSQSDPFKALLAYHATSLQATGLSPTEAMYGRIPHTSVPCIPKKHLQILLTQESLENEITPTKRRWRTFMIENTERERLNLSYQRNKYIYAQIPKNRGKPQAPLRSKLHQGHTWCPPIK